MEAKDLLLLTRPKTQETLSDDERHNLAYMLDDSWPLRDQLGERIFAKDDNGSGISLEIISRLFKESHTPHRRTDCIKVSFVDPDGNKVPLGEISRSRADKSLASASIYLDRVPFRLEKMTPEHPGWPFIVGAVDDAIAECTQVDITV